MKASSIFPIFVLCTACGTSASAPPVTVPPMPSIADLPGAAVPASEPSIDRAVETTSTAPERQRVVTGEEPWWSRLSSGVYRFNSRRVVLGMGQSRDHRHVTEGLLNARVAARLAVRKASERVAFDGAPPEPDMLDLFVTRNNEFLVLYEIRVPEGAVTPTALRELRGPDALRTEGDHRVGRHYFNGGRHLYLECDVEGPIANPDWGRSRVSARN